ncbi:hypothetical protein [Streptomyces rishiriensis]|uniref:hypothetical protein n=1 Tax=Streptomyces rishiriensis TaxID=68264 RepID=UPI001FECD446|nr:hypothetical protein [Streptomyces rishiriensis]
MEGKPYPLGEVLAVVAAYAGAVAEEHPWRTSVEAEVPDALSAESWREVMDVVAEAGRFGLLATSTNGRTLWAVVRNTVPTTGDVGGPGHER